MLRHSGTKNGYSLIQEVCDPFLLYSSVEFSVFVPVQAIVQWGPSSRWSSSLYCHRRNTDEMAIGKTRPTLEEPERPKNRMRTSRMPNGSDCFWSISLLTFDLGSFKNSRSIPFFSRLHRSSWVQSGEPPSNNELVRKRMYRIGLNLFNKKPEKGLSFLIKHSFVADSPNVIANFLVTRKGRVVKCAENQIVIAKNRNCEKLLKIVIFSF